MKIVFFLFFLFSISIVDFAQLDTNWHQLTKDYYLQKDYVNSIEAFKRINENISEEDFKLCGSSYKNTNQFTNAVRLYIEATKKYSNSGSLYAEWADVFFVQKKFVDAIIIWEKGIAASPDFATNYYYAALYYHQFNQPFWAAIYGEYFVNLERRTIKTAEIKTIIAESYKKILYSSSNAILHKNSFEGECYKNIEPLTEGLTINSLVASRTKFILKWFGNTATKSSSNSFYKRIKLLNKLGLHEAYTQWLFGVTINPLAYKKWCDNNIEKCKQLSSFFAENNFEPKNGEFSINQ